MVDESCIVHDWIIGLGGGRFCEAKLVALWYCGLYKIYTVRTYMVNCIPAPIRGVI